jgi:tryptophan synthase beta subunit
MVVNMSGRGDKDLFILARALDRDVWTSFLREEADR